MSIQLQTMALSFRQIQEQPYIDAWIPLGNFMNHWFGRWKIYRQQLVEDPLPIHNEKQLYDHRWATFCAASVIYLCDKYQVPCPAWPDAPIYHLQEPWFFFPNHDALLQSTPAAFASRNVFCGDDVYANKYELADSLSNLLNKKQPA